MKTETNTAMGAEKARALTSPLLRCSLPLEARRTWTDELWKVVYSPAGIGPAARYGRSRMMHATWVVDGRNRCNQLDIVSAALVPSLG